VRLVIADTGPINYLLLIGHIDILPALFEGVTLPTAVKEELSHPGAPALVRDWIFAPPPWVEIHEIADTVDDALRHLDRGEEAAILLALELHADLLLIDDREGVAAAEGKGLKVAGTLAILLMAAQHEILDLADAFDRLKRTNFHYRQEILDRFLDQERSSKT
jgi:predicted nucleic acid-binding protein